MSSPYDQAIEELMADYHRQLEQINENQRRIREITATAVSQRQQVSVTVGSRGDIVELKFPTDAYKRMAPLELASLITETFAEARRKASARVAELAKATAPAGFDMSALFGPDSDLGKVLPRNPLMPDDVREYVDNGRKAGPADAR
jgi:DNA-binding protein YbaB